MAEVGTPKNYRGEMDIDVENLGKANLVEREVMFI